MKIISYRKHIDSIITRTLVMPVDNDGQQIGTELATLSDGLTYVSMPSDAAVPIQPEEISASVITVVLTASQIDEIKRTSPHVALIRERVREKIRDAYSIEDEIKFLRLAPSPESSSYNTYVEDCRAWGRAQMALIGL